MRGGHIAVHDALRMHVAQRGQHLLRVLLDHTLVEGAELLQQPEVEEKRAVEWSEWGGGRKAT